MTASGMHRFVAHVVDDSPNEIHEDDVARRYGFSGALVPGVELFARTTTPLVAAWGAEWLSRGRIDLRFRRPTYDGDELLVELQDGQLTVREPSSEVRCVGSTVRSVDRPYFTGYRQPAEPVEEEEPATEADFADIRGDPGSWEGPARSVPAARQALLHGRPRRPCGTGLRQLERSAGSATEVVDHSFE